jgi:hypothetical protein
MSGNAAQTIDVEQSPYERIADLEAMLANQSRLLDAVECERKKAQRRVVRLARVALSQARRLASLRQVQLELPLVGGSNGRSHGQMELAL